MAGPLYTLTQWWLAVLPVDDAGRRCYDETLADWRKEASKASGSWAALIVSVRAVMAVLRCIGGVSLRDVALIGRSGVLPRVVLWTVAYLAILAAIVQLLPNIQPSPNSWTPSAISLIYRQVAAVASFLPIALLLATGLGGRRRAVPALGLAVVAQLVAFPLLGWGVPMANRAFLDANPVRSYSPAHPERGEELRPWKPGEGLHAAMEWHYWEADSPPPPRPFSNDLTVLQLGVTVARGPQDNGWLAVRYLSFFGAYMATCALAPLLASVLRRRSMLVRYGVVLLTAVMLYRPPSFVRLGGEFSVVLWLGAFWIPVIWMALCLIAVARRDTGFQTANNQ